MDGGWILRRTKNSVTTELKEKFIQIFDTLFRGEDPTNGRGSAFWDELFMLKVNAKYLSETLTTRSDAELLQCRTAFPILLEQCCIAMQDENQTRIQHSLEILSTILIALFARTPQPEPNSTIELVFGTTNAAESVKKLTTSLDSILAISPPMAHRILAFRLYLLLVTAVNELNQNRLIETLSPQPIFNHVVKILTDPAIRSGLSSDALLLLSLLINYRKHEMVNIYAEKLAMINDEIGLSLIGSTLAHIFQDFNRQWMLQTNAHAANGANRVPGWVSSISGMVSKMFTEANGSIEIPVESQIGGNLLAFYELVRLNRNFALILTHLESVSAEGGIGLNALRPDSPSTISTVTPESGTHQPNNVLTRLFTLSSFIFQSVADARTAGFARMCLIILTRVTEDDVVCGFLHDPKLNVPVYLHRKPTRHMSMQPPRQGSEHFPLACIVFELLIECMSGNLKRSFHMDLYTRAVGVVHRLLCYQKKVKCRLGFDWKLLWAGLVSSLRFLVSNEKNLIEENNIFQLMSQIVNIFNLFVTYGDIFLPNPSSYDELYYETIRQHDVFESCLDAAARHYAAQGNWKDSARRLRNDLVNVRAIVRHFAPKIDAWSSENGVAALTFDQVMGVIKVNYDTLTLKLQEGLDHYEPYTESEREIAHLRHFVRGVIVDLKQTMQSHV